ncbi:MAG: SMP-30/gluconolactonase/LRE family protein [Microscillaceae bacterium]|nr:SMP-30/gluconolactonase/LRE family protein [Microscillaceae bacterium]
MKLQHVFFLSVFLVCLLGCQGESNPEKKSAATSEDSTITSFKTIGYIERLDPALDAIIPKDAKIEILADGMNWAEGPLWLADKQWLLFTDVPENKIYKWSEEKGLETYLEPSGFTGDSTDSRERGANGLTLDAEGFLVMCQHGNRQIARMKSALDDPQPKYESIVAEYQGRRLNSPNDLVYDSKGNLYFTDPPYGLSEKMTEDPKKELPFQGVFMKSKDGDLKLISDKISRPNGIALSPDEKTLYIANSDPEKAVWMAFTLEEPGKADAGKVFYEATTMVGKEKGLPDGMKIDKQGNLFASGPGGIWVISPEAKVLGKIKTEQATANCAFNEDKSVLYITADSYLMRVKLK